MSSKRKSVCEFRAHAVRSQCHRNIFLSFFLSFFLFFPFSLLLPVGPRSHFPVLSVPGLMSWVCRSLSGVVRSIQDNEDLFPSDTRRRVVVPRPSP